MIKRVVFLCTRQIDMAIQLTLLKPNTNKFRLFWNALITVTVMRDTYYDLWDNKAVVVISYLDNEWTVNWWQRQPTVESSSRGEGRAPKTPPAFSMKFRSVFMLGRDIVSIAARWRWSCDRRIVCGIAPSYKHKLFCTWSGSYPYGARQVDLTFRQHIVEHTDCPWCREGSVCRKMQHAYSNEGCQMTIS